MNLRHITRFTYEFTNFQGWRVAISRQGTTLARYFSDKQFGSPELARDQALAFRDMVLDEINRNPEMTRDILYKYRVGTRKLQQPHSLSADTDFIRIRTAPVLSDGSMLDNLKKLCHYLQLDSAGMLKFALYLFMLQSGTANALQQVTGVPAPSDVEMNKLVSGANLQRIIDLLENHTPPAAAFSNDIKPLNANSEQVEPESLVPDEEIRAKESEQDMHNTSPPHSSEEQPPPQPEQQPQLPASPNVALNMMPSRPAPPSAMLSLPATSSTQHPTPQSASLHPPLNHRGITRHIATDKPARIATGFEYADSRPPNVI